MEAEEQQTGSGKIDASCYQLCSSLGGNPESLSWTSSSSSSSSQTSSWTSSCNFFFLPEKKKKKKILSIGKNG